MAEASGAGLLLGFQNGDPRTIRIVVLVGDGMVGRTITLHVEKPSIHPFAVEPQDAVLLAYAPLLPGLQSWTAVRFVTREIDKMSVHHAQVWVLSNPVWDANSFSIRPPDCQELVQIGLPEVLSFLTVLADPNAVRFIPEMNKLGMATVRKVVDSFRSRFRQLSLTDIQTEFDKWDGKLKERTRQRAALMDVLLRAGADVTAERLHPLLIQAGTLGGDARRRRFDQLLNPILANTALLAHLLDEPAYAAQVVEWLFRRTLNSTRVTINRVLARELEYTVEPEGVRVDYTDEHGGLLTVTLAGSHPRVQAQMLREIWGAGRSQINTLLQPRRTLANWLRLENYIKDVNFPFLEQLLQPFLRRESNDLRLVLAWDPDTGMLSLVPPPVPASQALVWV